jgi:hypothetical protein
MVFTTGYGHLVTGGNMGSNYNPISIRMSSQYSKWIVVPGLYHSL